MAEYIKAPSAQIDRGEVKPEKKIFQAIMRREDAPISEDVMQALKNNMVLVDSRSPGEYVGNIGSHSNNRLGTMPGAVNLPYSWLAEKGTGIFPNQGRLKLIFQKTKVPTTGDQIHFCHTGHRASLSWFVSHELLGNHQAKMYDGSMAEWAKNPELPMVSETQTDR